MKRMKLPFYPYFACLPKPGMGDIDKNQENTSTMYYQKSYLIVVDTSLQFMCKSNANGFISAETGQIEYNSLNERK